MPGATSILTLANPDRSSSLWHSFPQISRTLMRGRAKEHMRQQQFGGEGR